MATYVIGDVQGCFDTLQALLMRLKFDAANDRLWFCGDLVNRGPKSLEVLRFVRDLGDRAITVLGNHDLHLLARAAGLGQRRRQDTLDAVLAAPDCAELMTWLASRPLLYCENGYALVHAGFLPSWTLDDAITYANAAHLGLRERRYDTLRERKSVLGLRVLTTIRTCHGDGSLCDFAGSPSDAPPGCRAWFSYPERKSRGVEILFGHWSALGLYQGLGCYGLDSGCVWGGSLSALRLEDKAIVSEKAHEPPLATA